MSTSDLGSAKIGDLVAFVHKKELKVARLEKGDGGEGTWLEGRLFSKMDKKFKESKEIRQFDQGQVVAVGEFKTLKARGRGTARVPTEVAIS